MCSHTIRAGKCAGNTHARRGFARSVRHHITHKIKNKDRIYHHMEDQGSPSSSSPSSSFSTSSSSVDPKMQKKYARYIEMALKVEDVDPASALELYKQAEELMPNTLTEKISEIRAKMKGKKQTSQPENTTAQEAHAPIPPSSPPLPLPPPIDITELPDFSQTEFLQNLPPPPPPPFSSSPLSTSTPPAPLSSSPPTTSPLSESPSTVESSPPAGESSAELEVFLDQITDFLTVMSKEDVEEMVERKDFQLVSYLMSTTATHPPSDEHAALALKTAQCFMTTCEIVPAAFPAMVAAHVVTWVLRWCKHYIIPKLEAAKREEYLTENDEIIVYFLQLLAVLCGQQSAPLSQQERELLDDQAFVTMMIHFTIHEYEYDEDSDIAFTAAVCLFGISSQFALYSEDPIVFALYGIPEAATLGRFLIHVTNRGVTPKWLQSSALSTSRKLFEFSQAHQSEGYYFTNDMHVLLDVILREVLNLDEDKTELRMGYLKLLQAIITQHEYIAKGRYKHDNVVEVAGIIAFQEYDPNASSFAQNIFQSLVDNKS